MAKLSQPSIQTIDHMLKNAVLMRDVTDKQVRTAIDVARAAGWTYEQIMDATGYGYTAVRGLDPRLNEGAAA